MAEGKGPNGHGAGTRLGALLTETQAARPAVEAARQRPEPVAPAAPSAGPADVAGAASLPGVLPVSPQDVQELRLRVADDIKEERQRRGHPLERQDVEEVAEAFTHRRVAEWAAEHALTHPPLTREQQEQLRTEVFNLFFLAGSLQQVLNRPGVENIVLDGSWMYIDYIDQPRQKVPSPFGSDKRALDWVNQMASQSGHGERQLTYANGWVDFRLPDDSRVAATVLTSRQAIAIRRHRMEKAGLSDLVGWGTLDPLLATFLSACVKAGLNVVLAGDMNSGKTTMLRALGREIPARERVVTLETDRELLLDNDDTPAHVLAFESRASNGERDDSGRLIGEITIADLVPVSLRYNATRVMVGEVRSDEAVPMLEAMSAGGSGSMCTLHARDPEGVIERLMLRLSMAGLTDNAASRLIATAVDLIVYIDMIDELEIGGRLHRFVSHVWEVDGRSESGGVALTRLFAPQGEDPRAMPTKAPMTARRIAKLERKADFDRRWLAAYPQGQWPPMELVRPT
ncbi:CpaF/VirB11 family protein [Streptomyces sp. NBC_01381]|uniref:CpaF family protein n=1 Tax=Streptomyces sp. NBC_01381 TaxID=2903845 RepID=UPI0022568619|nr:CpaF/VirB11 family protein [Streptomyces sp. NBC_01381]MCX4673647.1 CpaF/VirB11 family protein [Streptomyces sp. NBC_01381]